MPMHSRLSRGSQEQISTIDPLSVAFFLHRIFSRSWIQKHTLGHILTRAMAFIDFRPLLVGQPTSGVVVSPHEFLSYFLRYAEGGMPVRRRLHGAALRLGDGRIECKLRGHQFIALIVAHISVASLAVVVQLRVTATRMAALSVSVSACGASREPTVAPIWAAA